MARSWRGLVTSSLRDQDNVRTVILKRFLRDRARVPLRARGHPQRVQRIRIERRLQKPHLHGVMLRLSSGSPKLLIMMV